MAVKVTDSVSSETDLISRLACGLDGCGSLQELEEALGKVLQAREVSLTLGTSGGSDGQKDRYVLSLPFKGGEVASLEIGWVSQGKSQHGEMEMLRRACQVSLVPRVESLVLADQCRHLKTELARRDFSLYSVYQVGRELGAVLDLDEVLRVLTDMLAEVMTVRAAYVLLRNEDLETWSVRGAHVPLKDLALPTVEIRETDHVGEWLASLGWEARAVDPFEDFALREAFPDAATELEKASVRLLVPLLHDKRLVGLLALGEKSTGDAFQASDLEFMTVIAPLAANAVTNALLYQQAILDGLTRVYVIRYFRQRFREELKRARRYGSPASLIMLGVDYFKHVNDAHGHLVGDKVLYELAQKVKHACRIDVDLVGRYGGDEFVILLPETGKEGAIQVALRLRKILAEQPFTRHNLSLTVSCGLASYPEDGTECESLFARADEEMYRAKRAGRNRVALPDDDSREAERAADPPEG